MPYGKLSIIFTPQRVKYISPCPQFTIRKISFILNHKLREIQKQREKEKEWGANGEGIGKKEKQRNREREHKKRGREERKTFTHRERDIERA